MGAQTGVADKARERFLDGLLDRMSLDQKVGQCFTVHWGGGMVSPYTVDAVKKLHIGGFRITPFGQNSRRGKHYHQSLSYDFDYPPGYEKCKQNLFIPGVGIYIEPEEYAGRVNRLQQIAMERDPGIPLHFTLDQEGDMVRDYSCGGINLFPGNMGYAATGSPELTYEAALGIGRQMSALGVTHVQALVLDVNADPRNPEINIRAYSDDPEVVTDYGRAMMNGLHDGGVIATAKHFPGRGDSPIDAHYQLPVIDKSWEELEALELHPYRALIREGLRSIMLAHTAVTAADPSGEISTVSRPIVTGMLRERLGFEGVVTTDSITMGALMKKYGVGRACALAVKAGCDRVLNKCEDEFRDQAFLELRRCVQTGEIPEEQLNASVRRILRMKYDQGLFKRAGQVDADRASDPIRDPETIRVCRDVARECVTVFRDEDDLLPLSPKQTVMLIEQKLLPGYAGFDVHCHDKAFNEAVYEESLNVIGLDTSFKATADDEAMVLEYAAQADVIVATNFYWRLCPHNNTALIRKLLADGRQVVVVTNVPYEFGVVPEARTVVCCYGATPESYRATARVLYGRDAAPGVWPLRHSELPGASVPLSDDVLEDTGSNEITGPVF